MELWSLKCQKWLIFCIFYWCQQIISHGLEKIFTCIWKILNSSFRKCYGLLDSELPLARYQPLKIQSFIIFLLTQQFFDISTLDISQTVTPRPIKHTFSKRTQRDLSDALKCFAYIVTDALLPSAKNTKNETFFDKWP